MIFYLKYRQITLDGKRFISPQHTLRHVYGVEFKVNDKKIKIKCKNETQKQEIIKGLAMWGVEEITK